jgi:hypothetical protein
MSYTASYDKGNWKALCDVCGRLYKATTLQKRWDGLMCCDDDWEIRQPQDFVKGQADHQIAPWIRSESTNNFIPFDFTSFLNAITGGTTCTIDFRYIAYNVEPKQLNTTTINDTTIG